MFSGLPVFLGDASYIDFNMSKSILSGHGFSTGPNTNGDFTPFGKRPPGFSLLVAFLVYLGVPIIMASITITTISYALIPVFVFLIFKHYCSSNKAFLMALIVLLHPSLIYYSKIAAPEIIGVSILAATYYLYLRWIENQHSEGENYFHVFLLGLMLGLTIWFRYANAIYVVIFSGLIFFYAVLHARSRKSAGFALAFGGFLSISLLIRNYIYTGHLSGHPVISIKTNDIDVAIVKAFNLLTNHQFGLDVNDTIFAIIFVVLLMVISIFTIIKSYKDKLYLFKILPIAIMPLAYLLFFSYLQSITRVDDVSSRYLLPFYLSIIIQIIFILYSLNNMSKYNFLFKSIFIVSVVFYSYASYKIGSADRTFNDRDYAPETINYILKNVEKGSTIIGSRYLGQLLMHSLDYGLLGLRFYSNYNKDYGRKLSYDKKELIEKILKHKIKYLVIFTGKDKKENFINRSDYGEFVTSLVKNGSDIVESKIKLSDGIVITFKDRPYLSNILDYFDNSKSLVNKDYLASDLKVTSPKGAFKVTNKDIIFSQDKVIKAANFLLSFNTVKLAYTANIKYTLPIEPLRKIAVTIRNGDQYAHFFFNRNEIKFDELSLRLDNIDQKSDKFSMDSLNSMTIRLYPVKKNSKVTNFKINSINIYSKK